MFESREDVSTHLESAWDSASEPLVRGRPNERLGDLHSLATGASASERILRLYWKTSVPPIRGGINGLYKEVLEITIRAKGIHCS
jgi:hypothetical protein